MLYTNRLCHAEGVTTRTLIPCDGSALSLEAMLAVVNVSTGRNTATSDKFPNRIVTGTYDAGFATALLAKDLGLYVERARAAGAPATIGEMIAELWRAAAEAMPASDITRIYDLIRGGAATGAGPPP